MPIGLHGIRPTPKRRSAGSSNFAGWDIATAQCTAASRNLLGLASEQSLYNLTQRTIELEVIPPCEEIWQAMEQLIREGKITYVDCGPP